MELITLVKKSLLTHTEYFKTLVFHEMNEMDEINETIEKKVAYCSYSIVPS